MLDPDDKVFGIIGVFTITALVIVSIRIYIRAIVKKTTGVDDLFAAVASAGVITTAVATIWAHVLDHNDTAKPNSGILKAVLVSFYSFWVSEWATKMSILYACLRVFGIKRTTKQVIYALATLCTLHTISAILSLLLQCRPMSNFWTPRLMHSGCTNSTIIYITHACINLCTDTLTYILPMVLVLRSPLDPAKKRFLICVFAVCSLTLLAAVGRIVALALFKTTVEHETTAIAWDILSISSCVEITTGLIATSLPVLAPVLKNQWISLKSIQHPSRSHRVTTRSRSISDLGIREPQASRG
ncbi:hypothetical protein BT63DRAFT_234469 [Microthyrium microscopicum]|uniref:Rhodopsin domain-containing protein n=1 Tax=Microthyrium microscopicum TaxID=703497 RepID=A0A6A6UGU1_9PEZI|nr:hypothetical protein BT63DRAFT_234469 [Microthyrium microscopicum]